MEKHILSTYHIIRNSIYEKNFEMFWCKFKTRVYEIYFLRMVSNIKLHNKIDDKKQLKILIGIMLCYPLHTIKEIWSE